MVFSNVTHPLKQPPSGDLDGVFAGRLQNRIFQKNILEIDIWSLDSYYSFNFIVSI